MEKWTDDQIRELCEEATPGPWEWEKYDEEIAPGAVVASAGWLELPLVYTQQGAAFHLEDVEFIVAARELVPALLKRAQRAEAELRRCYKDMEELTAKNNDLRAQVADARIRNDVLQRRLDKLLERFAGVMIETRNSTWERRWCPNKEHQVSCDEFTNCTKCWISYLAQKLEQEVQA